MADTTKCASPHDVLIRALEKVEKMSSCIIIYETDNGDKMGSLDSGLTVAQAIYMMRAYEHWLLNHVFTESE